MTQKFFFSSILMLMLVLTSGCSSLTASAAPAGSATSSAAGAAKAALSDNLGIGILKLEGSALQVSAEQADSLLLLWKGVKLLTSDKSASAIELAALFEQIQENMTAEQLAVIRDVTWTQEEVALAMRQYAGTTTVAAAVKNSSAASSSSVNAGPGGGPGGPGGDLAIISGMSAASGTSSSSSTSAQAKAIAASKSSSSGTAAGMNAQLADAVIALLQKRAGGL